MIRPKFNPDWSDHVKGLYKHDMEEYWDKSIVPNAWNQYRNLLDYYLSIAHSSDPLDILDIGCAQGTLALLLAEAGHKVCAVDLRQESIDYAKSRYEKGTIEFLKHNVLEMKLPQKFDLIFANQIIEHLVYPKEMIEQLNKQLKPGGRLIISTPNHAYFKSKHPSFTELGDPKQWEHKQFSSDGDGHFFAYTQDELISLFEQSGMKQITSQVFETPFMSGHMKIRYLHKILPYPVLRMLDRFTLRLPLIGKRLSHQLAVIGVKH